MLRCLLTVFAVLQLQTSMRAQQVSHPEYIEVEKNVHLHLTDVGSGRPTSTSVSPFIGAWLEKSGHALFVEERDKFNTQLIQFAAN